MKKNETLGNSPYRVKEIKNPSCCGGAPLNNKEACCKLDENKKAKGEGGCGCSATNRGNK